MNQNNQQGQGGQQQKPGQQDQQGGHGGQQQGGGQQKPGQQQQDPGRQGGQQGGGQQRPDQQQQIPDAEAASRAAKAESTSAEVLVGWSVNSILRLAPGDFFGSSATATAALLPPCTRRNRRITGGKS